MSRPMYENSGDRNNEHEIMSSVAGQWGVQFYKLPIAYRMDYILMSAEKAKAFVECKHRNITWGDYPDVMLSLSKVQQAQSLLDASGLRSLFVVRRPIESSTLASTIVRARQTGSRLVAGHTTPEMQRTWSQSCTYQSTSSMRCRLGKMQRDKGKRGEREVVQIMQSIGWPEARRSRQSDGAVDPDVAGCDPFWIEVKRRKSIAACRFMDQAETDGNEKKNPHRLPLVFMREDGGEWLVMLKAEQMMAVALQLIHAADKSCGQSRCAKTHHDEGSQDPHTA